MQERCKTDGEMSEDFIKIANDPNYVVQVSTSIGWITLEEPEYRNCVSYRAIREEEV